MEFRNEASNVGWGEKGPRQLPCNLLRAADPETGAEEERAGERELFKKQTHGLGCCSVGKLLRLGKEMVGNYVNKCNEAVIKSEEEKYE